MKLGFIGTGNMAGAIMGGIIKKGIIAPEDNIFCGKTGFVTDYADDRNLFALGQMCGQTVCFNILCDSLYIFIRCLRFHYNDHK